ncbi:MFS transporter [Paenibacillus sp. MWE-103]|uniref:MFS transporter n=2 Tax=Paenibacillus artemisiicola TaxID=1172618 RepID=A0ABS3WCX9_9BACL|nr:MFS transporter [Paenibacillus artemisiicola]
MDMEQTLRLTKEGGTKRPLLLFGLSLGYFMVLLDTTAVSVALPAIGADLGGGMQDLQWVANAYTIAFAGLLLSMGALADRLGAKRVYLGGLALFAAASALSAAAPGIGGLIALRAALGIGGAALLPASLTLLAQAYPDKAARARAMGFWAAATGVAMAAGPVAGGLLVDAAGWRTIFLLNVPPAVFSLIVTNRLAGNPPRAAGRGLDPAGQLAAVAAIASLSYALMQGDADGWRSPRIVAAFAVAAASVAGFAIAEARVRTPLLPLRLLRKPAVAGGLAAGMAINVALSGLLFALPYYGQRAGGLSARDAGLALLPMMLPLAFNPILTGRIVGRIGAKLPMAAGFALAAAGTLLLALADAQAGSALAIAGLLLTGFGVSFAIPSVMTAVIAAVAPEETGTASGALNAARQLGATFGVALVALVLSRYAEPEAGLRASLLGMAVLLLGGVPVALFGMGGGRRSG